MDKCIIWGNGRDYEKIINQIRFEEIKGNLEIVAVVARYDEIFGTKRDGYPLITKDKLLQIDFDTLIIASSAYYEEILEEVNDIGVSEKNIINGKVFNIPLFDYKQYISLVKFPVTILSDDCWGGYVYHELCLPFTSPLVNIYWQRDSYCKFIVDPLYYFEQPLELLKEIDFRENIYPVGRIGEGDREGRGLIEIVFLLN